MATSKDTATAGGVGIEPWGGGLPRSVRKANRTLLRRVGARRIPSARLRTIAAPVTLIWGKQDPVMPFRFAETAAANYGWTLEAIDECGHVPMMEPSRFLEALKGAL